MTPSLLELGLLVEAPTRSPLRIAVRAGARVKRIRLRHAPDGEEEVVELQRTASGFATDRLAPRADLHYRFLVDLDDGRRWVLNAAGLSEHEPLDRFDFVLRQSGPAWTRSAVAYQIFPDRFAMGDPSLGVREGEYRHRGHSARRLPFEAAPLPYSETRCLDFRGGDLPGITAKLDHLQSLGADTLYLTPIHPAFTNHRYDVTDFEAIDAHLGGEKAFAELTAALRERGMRIILDSVINHVGSGHRWLNREGRYLEPGAYQDARSPYAGFFFFRQHPTNYLSWKGIDTLPRLDFRSKHLRELLWGDRGALKKWLRPPFQIDGYRFDCANMVGRAGEVQLSREVWSELAQALHGDGDPYLVGEHWFDPQDTVGPGRLHGGIDYLGFTFPLRRFFLGKDRDGSASPISGQALLAQLGQTNAAQGGSQNLICINSHDVARLQTSASPEAFRAATQMQLFWPGTPCLYYGDEIGLGGGEDPDNRRSMIWDSSQWDRGALALIRESVAARRRSVAMSEGQLVPLASGDDWAAFARVHPREVAIAIVARGKTTVELDLSALRLPPMKASFHGPGSSIATFPLS